jgi:hypothetical protein
LKKNISPGYKSLGNTKHHVYASPFEEKVDAVPKKFHMKAIHIQSNKEMTKMAECTSSGISRILHLPSPQHGTALALLVFLTLVCICFQN